MKELVSATLFNKDKDNSSSNKDLQSSPELNNEALKVVTLCLL